MNVFSGQKKVKVRKISNQPITRCNTNNITTNIKANRRDRLNILSFSDDEPTFR